MLTLELYALIANPAELSDLGPPSWDLREGPILLVLLVLLVLGLLLWCYFRPVVGRIVARIFAVIGMGLGVGLLVWGITAAARRETPASGLFLDLGVSGIIGCGAGCLTAGIVALVLSFIGPKAQPCPPNRSMQEPFRETQEGPPRTANGGRGESA